MMDRMLSKLRDSIGGIRVRSAMNPLLWLVSPLMVGVIAAMYFAERLYQIDYEWIITGTFGLFAFAVITALGCYVYFMLSDPDKLRSEEYLIRPA